METSSHVCSLHMAAFDDPDTNLSLQTTSHMYIWKKAKTCLFVPCVCSVCSTMLVHFAVCTCGCIGVWLARVLLCVSNPAGVEDALEQQREFDEHVVESKRYAYLYFLAYSRFVARASLSLTWGGARIAELAEEGQRANLKLKAALSMQESLVKRANDLVGLLSICVRSIIYDSFLFAFRLQGLRASAA